MILMGYASSGPASFTGMMLLEASMWLSQEFILFSAKQCCPTWMYHGTFIHFAGGQQGCFQVGAGMTRLL